MGFSQYPQRSLVSKNNVIHDIPVISGDIPFVGAETTDEIRLCLSEEESARLEEVLELPRFVYAPVSKGNTAGNLLYKLDGKVIAQTKLVYQADAVLRKPVRKGFWKSLWDVFGGIVNTQGV
jgi:D-alanyl-D-alanine carboxypeptidase